MDVSADPYLPYDGGGGDGIPLRELHKRGMPDWRLGDLFAWLYVRDRCPPLKRPRKGLLIIQLLCFACPMPFVGGEFSAGWFLCCRGCFLCGQISPASHLIALGLHLRYVAALPFALSPFFGLFFFFVCVF